jgi:L-fuconolactonase
MTLRIDAHQHFWRYDAAAYPWMGAGMDVLRRDWLPHDLRPLLDAQGIDACIAVQARACEAETDFLLGLADRHDWIVGVIGWVDLRAADLGVRLARWQNARALAGFRHLLQDDPYVAAALADARFNRGLQQLQDNSLVYEVLVRGAAQLEQTPAFCARHDRHWLVLDHLGKPAIGGDQDPRWHDALRELAAMPHVMCKLSGLVTEVVGPYIDADVLRRYLDTALDLFGPQRLLFGSDWPVCLLRAPYAEVIRIIDDWSRALSADERALLWGGNAVRCYGLPRAEPAPAESSRWS